MTRTQAALVACLLCGCTNELLSHRLDGGADAARGDAGADASPIDADVVDDAFTAVDALADALADDAFVVPASDAFVSGTDDATTVNAPLPRGFGCTAATTTTVTMQNTGTTTWSAGYALSAVDAADPLARGAHAALAAGESVAPGEMHDFSVVLGATGVSAGTHTTSWRMERSGMAFGATVSSDVVVYACETVDPAGFDLASVTIVSSPDVRGFARTSTMTEISFHPSSASWHVDHTLRGTWPPVVIEPTDGTTQEATIWIIFRIGGTWYATGAERLRPNQTDKGLTNPSQMGPDLLYDPGRWGVMSGYVPSPGDLVGLFIAAGSTRSDDHVMVMERTNAVLFAFPPDDVDSAFPPFAWTE